MDEYYRNLNEWMKLKKMYIDSITKHRRNRCSICKKKTLMTFHETVEEYDMRCDEGCVFRLRKPNYGRYDVYIKKLGNELGELIDQLNQLKLDYVYNRIDVETLNKEFEPLIKSYEQTLSWISIFHDRHMKQRQTDEIKKTYNQSFVSIQDFSIQIQDLINEERYKDAVEVYINNIISQIEQMYECYEYIVLEPDNNIYEYKKKWKYDFEHTNLFLLNSSNDMPRVLEYKKS